jgi:hypothetical protein
VITLKVPATAKVASTLTPAATMTASACPSEVRARLGPWSRDVLIVPPAQSLPAASAPIRKNAAVPGSG